MATRWRIEYERALVDWIERQRPSLLQASAIRWASRCKSVGPPPEDTVPSPDPDRPEDRLTTIPMANIDILYLVYEAAGEKVVMVRDFTSF